jgi:hypothetical protein
MNFGSLLGGISGKMVSFTSGAPAEQVLQDSIRKIRG